jgi:hypothetical protein
MTLADQMAVPLPREVALREALENVLFVKDHWGAWREGRISIGELAQSLTEHVHSFLIVSSGLPFSHIGPGETQASSLALREQICQELEHQAAQDDGEDTGV